MTKTIAVVGAGPGIGLHVAERFGREGFRAALVARSQESLDGYVGKLAELGIEARGFRADATDEADLVAALTAAEAAFGTIDVLEYSPIPSGEAMATPRNITVENLRPQLGFTIGAVVAVQHVLPGMLARSDGALLFTSAVSAIEPFAFTANFAVAQTGIRSYAHSLHRDLAADGIYAGIVLVAGGVDKGDGSIGPEPRAVDPALVAASPMSIIGAWEIADTFWSMYTERDRIEAVVGDMEVLKRLMG
jgi:NAD(P)-dependent dehydrogenase (short-subunit alcohol dehydrogenase family)